MSPESIAMDLLASLCRYEREMADYAISLTLHYDFGAGSGVYPFLDLGDSDELWQRVRVSNSIRVPVSVQPFVSNEIWFNLTLAFSRAGCRVESGIEAQLDVRMGEWGPGSHVLHRELSEGLSFAEALENGPRHIAALYRVPSFPESLGVIRSD